jgi:hypothetical protein
MKQRRVTDHDRTEIEAFRAELVERFNARRCACGAPAELVIVGDEPSVEVGIRLSAGRPDRNLCLFHAGLLEQQEAA